MRINLKKEIRVVLKRLAQHCGYDNFVELGGKKYSIGCMSYDEYFIEPFRKGKTERDEFHKDTLWEKSDGLEILQILHDNEFISLCENETIRVL